MPAKPGMRCDTVNQSPDSPAKSGAREKSRDNQSGRTISNMFSGLISK
jgi:hypothetical protein